MFDLDSFLQAVFNVVYIVLVSISEFEHQLEIVCMSLGYTIYSSFSDLQLLAPHHCELKSHQG